MHNHNILYRGLTIVALLTLLLPAASPPTTAAPPSANPAHPLFSPTANAGWEEVGTGSASGGGISDNSGYSYSPSVAIAPDGTLYVAWHDLSGGDWEIYIRRWNGSNWEEVGSGSATGGGISNNSGGSTAPQ